MKPKLKVALASIIVTTLGVVAANCGGDGAQETPTPPPPTSGSSVPLGNFDMSCPKSGEPNPSQQQTQQQVQFKPEEQEGCSQQFRFTQSKVSDFHFKLDCDSHEVVVKGDGDQGDEETFPIEDDGRVRGGLNYQQRVEDDGYGSICFVGYIVKFDGKADCHGDPSKPDSLDITTTVDFSPADGGESSPSPSPSPSFFPDFPSPSPSPFPSESPIPDVFPSASPSPSDIPEAPFASPSPSASPGEFFTPSPSPSLSPSPSPSPSVSPSPSGHPHPSPSPTETVTITPIRFCIVRHPCPIVAETKMKCPGPQQQGEDSHRHGP